MCFFLIDEHFRAFNRTMSRKTVASARKINTFASQLCSSSGLLAGMRQPQHCPQFHPHNSDKHTSATENEANFKLQII